MSDILYVPLEVCACPICGAQIVIDAIDEWEDTGKLSDTGFSIDCVTEPPFDVRSHYSNEKNLAVWDKWIAWFNRHWSQPYTDWMPITPKVRDWFNAHYRVNEAGEIESDE